MAPRARVPERLKQAPFTPAEADQAGLSRDQLRGRRWRRLSPGWYVWTGLSGGPELILAAVARRLPPGSAFSGRTAAWLHGLDLPPCDPVEATVPNGCGVSVRAGVRIRRTVPSELDVVYRRGLPVTSALRTAFELAASRPLVEAVVAVDMALYHGLVDKAALAAYAVARSGVRGVARARRSIELSEPGVESPMESRLRMVLVLARLPRPAVQVSLYNSRGDFVGRPDLYYAAQRLGVEYDGGNHRITLEEDNRRQNRLLNAGYRLLRFTGDDVYNKPRTVVAQVRAELSSRRYPQLPAVGAIVSPR